LALRAVFAVAASAFAAPAAAQIIAQSLGWCAPHAAAPTDVKPGILVHDSYGIVVGSIESVAADDAVIKSDNGYVRVPVQAFGVCPTGLVLSMSSKQFKKLVMSAQGPK
jgi:hypothetical protein